LKKLYSNKGIYSYSNGFKTKAIIALLVGIIPNVPGFLVTVKLLPADSVASWIEHLYNYAWFVGFVVSGIVYRLLMKKN